MATYLEQRMAFLTQSALATPPNLAIPKAATPPTYVDGAPPMPVPPGGTGTNPGTTMPAPEPEPEIVAPESLFDNDLFAQFKATLAQFGLVATDEFLREAVMNKWSDATFTIKMREQDWYLANPLFRQNIENARDGKPFKAEGEIIAWAAEARRVSKQYGYEPPSDSYLAEGLKSGVSLAEIEHRLQISDRVNQYGGAVRSEFERLGFEVSDQDLFEIFDPEVDTKQWDDAYRTAQYTGRPFTLGLGVRSEAEARALEMLGVSPDEAFSRYEAVGQNKSRFEKLRSIEDLISQGLPDNFGSHLMTAENGTLIKALVFQDPEALAQLQNMTAREISRFKVGGAPVSSQGLQLGLLSDSERASFG